jgi:DNA-binding NarL/FixJ family response regulator
MVGLPEFSDEVIDEFLKGATGGLVFQPVLVKPGFMIVLLQRGQKTKGRFKVERGEHGRLTLWLSAIERYRILPLFGLALARQIRQRTLDLPILSARSQENYINGALQVGVRGFVLKDEAPDVLPQAIRSALRGEVWLSGAVAQKIATRAFRDRRPDYGLTPRELDVLRRMVQGKNDAAIAAELGVTTRSLRTYLRNIYDKMEVHSRVQAMAKALSEKIIAVSMNGDDGNPE